MNTGIIDSQDIQNLNDKIESQSTTTNIFRNLDAKRKTQDELNQLANQIKQSTFDEITVFGEDEIKVTEEFANKILETTKGSDMMEINNIINNVVKICQQDVRKRTNFFSKIIGVATDKIEDIKRQYSSIQQHLDTLVEELQRKKESITEGRKTLEGMIVKVYEDYCLVADYLEAFKIAKIQLTEELNVNQTDEMQAILFSEGKSFMIELLNQRIDDLTVSMTALKQTSLQIIREVSNSKRVELRLNSIEERTIKLWKNSIVLYINSLRLKDTISMTDAIQKATDTLWLENAKQISENSKEVFKTTSKSLLSFDAVESVNKIIIDNLQEIQKISLETNKTREQNYVRLESLSKKLELPNKRV